MSKKRVYEVAKELGVTSKELLSEAEKVGFEYSSHMASMTDEEISKLKGNFANAKNQANNTNNDEQKAKAPVAKAEPTNDKKTADANAKKEPAKANANQQNQQKQSQNRPRLH